MKIITKVKNTRNTSIYQKNVFTLPIEKQTYYKPIKNKDYGNKDFFKCRRIKN